MTVPTNFQDVIGYWVNVHDLTLTLDTSAYAQHDVLAATQELAGVVGLNGGAGVIQSIVLIDEDGQGKDLDLIFLRSNVFVGTENAAVSITDANARQIIGSVSIVSANYVGMVNNNFATIKNIGLAFKCLSNSTSLYVAAVLRAAAGATYTAEGIKLRIGILQGL